MVGYTAVKMWRPFPVTPHSPYLLPWTYQEEKNISFFIKEKKSCVFFFYFSLFFFIFYFYLDRKPDILPACFCDNHLCPNVMKSFPQVSTLQFYLDLFHGWRWRRLRTCSTRCKVRMGAKWTGCPFCQHLCVWPSALLWVCKINIPGKTLWFYLL